MSKNIVIIGLGTGGLYASRAASRVDRSASITIIERRPYDMYSPCGLPYAIEGKVKTFEELKHSVPSTRQLKKLIHHEAIRIDTENKRVHVKNLETQELFWVEYDSLIVCTGSRPSILPIPGAQAYLNKGVYTCSTPEEAETLRDAALKSRNAVVVGGGAIGLELAFALKELGLNIHITKRSPPPLPRNLDPDMGKKLLEYLEGHGLHIHFGKGIDKINGGENVDSVTIAGEDIPADIVVMAVGVVPQSKLAEEAGINVERGYVVVNDRMETSIKDIYALGDCTVSHSGVDGKPVTVALATTAFMQGSVAGVNAAGGDKVYDGSLGTFVSYIGEIEVSCTGYNSTTAERNGFNVITGRANMLTKPGWMPDAKNISVKLVADADSGRLLGGQAIGEEGASWRINIVALAVKQRMTVEDFVAIELAYCPAVSELFDPLVVAADILNRRYNRANKQ